LLQNSVPISQTTLRTSWDIGGLSNPEHLGRRLLAKKPNIIDNYLLSHTATWVGTPIRNWGVCHKSIRYLQGRNFEIHVSFLLVSVPKVRGYMIATKSHTTRG